MQKCISITDVVHGAAYSGHYRQVVLIQKCIRITDVVHGAAYSGHYRQVVLIQKCISITEVVHGAAYSGHYRQVVFKTGLTVVSFNWDKNSTIYTLHYYCS